MNSKSGFISVIRIVKTNNKNLIWNIELVIADRDSIAATNRLQKKEKEKSPQTQLNFVDVNIPKLSLQQTCQHSERLLMGFWDKSVTAR